MSIKAVFFDAAGTLFEPVRRVGESYAAFAARYGVEVTPVELSKRFKLCFEEAPRLAFPKAEDGEFPDLEREWWRTLVARVFEPCGRFDRFEAFFDELFTYFATAGAWRLYPDVLAALTELRERGVQMSVISNFDSRLLAILDGLEATPFFDRVFVSSRVGYAKPDPRIFQAALQYHGIVPEEALHIGDSEVNDLQGATDAGIRALLIQRNETPGEGRIASLAAILDMIDAPASETGSRRIRIERTS